MDINTPHRFLVVGPSWVGDMVMGQSLFKLLRQRHEHCEITVLAPPWSRALLDRMPEVDQSIELPFVHGELSLGARRRFARTLAGRFDVAILLPNSFKSALIPFFARIVHRVGWRGEFRQLLLTDCRKLDRKKYPLMVQRFAALGVDARSESVPAILNPELTTDPGSARKVAESMGLELTNKIMAICPGAEFGDSKQWPATHYARLCELAAAANWHIWMIGSPNDRETTRQILAAIDPDKQKNCYDVAGQTTLDQAIDLLSLARVVASNDSGLMHIAAAVGVPVVALYGSTSPDFTPPLAESVKSLSTEISCRPCFQRSCPLGHKRCLTEISADRVYDEMQDLLQRG